MKLDRFDLTVIVGCGAVAFFQSWQVLVVGATLLLLYVVFMIYRASEHAMRRFREIEASLVPVRVSLWLTSPVPEE